MNDWLVDSWTKTMTTTNRSEEKKNKSIPAALWLIQLDEKSIDLALENPIYLVWLNVNMIEME